MSGQLPFTEADRLAGRIREIGFSCTRCGDCCAARAGDNNLVMVSPGEVRRISAHSRLRPDEVAEPYPESVTLPGGTSLTFGWALRRPGGDCRFYGGGRCHVYASRPWICRTYPFMLDGEDLLVFPCRGIGGQIHGEDAGAIARDLIARRSAEREEEERVRKALSSPLPAGKTRLLVDGEGVRPL